MDDVDVADASMC